MRDEPTSLYSKRLARRLGPAWTDTVVKCVSWNFLSTGVSENVVISHYCLRNKHPNPAQRPTFWDVWSRARDQQTYGAVGLIEVHIHFRLDLSPHSLCLLAEWILLAMKCHSKQNRWFQMLKYQLYWINTSSYIEIFGKQTLPMTQYNTNRRANIRQTKRPTCLVLFNMEMTVSRNPWDITAPPEDVSILMCLRERWFDKSENGCVW